MQNMESPVSFDRFYVHSPVEGIIAARTLQATLRPPHIPFTERIFERESLAGPAPDVTDRVRRSPAKFSPPGFAASSALASANQVAEIVTPSGKHARRGFLDQPARP